MLVTLADAKDYLDISSADTSDDAFLTVQLNLLSDTVEAYCRRSFNSASYVQTYYSSDYKPSYKLETFQYPLISVASIVIDTDAPLDTSEYRINKTNGAIIRTPPNYFFGGYCAGLIAASQTVVTYTAGYVTIPTIITSVILDLLQERYNKKKSGTDLNFGSDVQSISIPGSISVDFDYSLSNNERTSAFGVILGSNVNALDYYRSERAVLGESKLIYLE